MPTRNNYLQGSASRSAYSPAAYTPMAYNAVGMTAPIQENFNTLAQSLKQIEDRKEKTDALEATISSEIGKLNLNPADDEWKYNYINDIRKQINNSIQFGDYSAALDTARHLALDVFTNPALRGRVRAQENYQTFVDTINKRDDLTEADKAWALAKNPYSYTDITDSNGNIVGGSDWKPEFTPVGEIKWNNIFATAKQLVHQKIGHTTSFKFEDASGHPTNDIRQAARVMYKTTTGWNGIEQEDLANLVEAAIDNTPGARDRIDQEWKVLNWQDETGRIDSSNKELYADNGRRYSKEEWYNNRFNKPLASMSGMNYTKDIDIDNNYFSLKAASSTQAQVPATGNQYYDLIRGAGTPIEDTNDTFNLAAGKVNNALSEIEKIGPALKNNPIWIKAKNEGNFKQLADIVAKTKFITTDERRDKLNHFINELRNNASIVTQVIKKGGDTQAYVFNAAFTTGGELPANNKYTKDFMKDYNAFTKGAKTLRYSFDNNEDLADFCKSLGIETDGKDAGLVSEMNGKPTIELDVSDTKNYRAMSLYDPGDIQLIDTNDNIIRNNYSYRQSYMSIPGLGTRVVNYRYLRDIPNKAKYITKQSLNTRASGATPTTYTSKLGLLPQIENAKIRKQLGLLNDSGYEKEVKDANRTWINIFKRINGSQVKMAVLGKDGTILRFVNSAERLQYMNAIQSRLNGDSDAEDLIGTYTYANDIGVHVRIPAYYNKNKGAYVSSEVPATEVVIFGIDDPIIKSMKGDTNFRGTRSYNNIRKFKDVNYTFSDGSSVKWDESTRQVPTFTDINGNSYEVNDNFLTNRFSAEEGYNDVRDAIIQAISATPYSNNRTQYIQNITNNSASAINLYNHWMQEYYPNITDNKAKLDYFMSIVERTINETKDIK